MHLILCLFSAALVFVLPTNGQVESCQDRDSTIAQVCQKPCTAQSDCRAPNKQCNCDGTCGLSCFNRNLDCPLPPTNPNVVDEPEGTKYGNLLSSSCSGGYIRLNGSLSRFCHSDKTWSGTPLYCQRGCPTGSNHRNATPTTFDAGYAVGHQLLYSCNTGYVAVDTRANFRLTCQSDYTWTAPTFQCLLGVCPSLSNSTSTQVIAPAFTFGSRVTITCNTGYEMSASSVRLLCDRTQSNEFIWSPSVPQCNIKRCPTPAAPLNGRVNLRSAQPYNAVATYTCNSGYKLVEPAPVTRTCGDNRQWGTTPVCIESPDCGFEVPTLPTCSYTNNGWTRLSSGLTFDGNPGFFAKASVSSTLTSVSLTTSQCLNFHYRVASSSPGSSFTLETTPQNGSPSTVWNADLNQPTWTEVKVPLNVGANPITFTFKVDTTNADVQLDGITVQPLNTCPVLTTTTAPITSTTAPTPITTTLKTSSGVVVVTGGEPRIPSDKNTTNIPTTTFPTTTTQTEPTVIYYIPPNLTALWVVLAILGLIGLVLLLCCCCRDRMPWGSKVVNVHEETFLHSIPPHEENKPNNADVDKNETNPLVTDRGVNNADVDKNETVFIVTDPGVNNADVDKNETNPLVTDPGVNNADVDKNETNLLVTDPGVNNADVDKNETVSLNETNLTTNDEEKETLHTVNTSVV